MPISDMEREAAVYAGLSRSYLAFQKQDIDRLDLNFSFSELQTYVALIQANHPSHYLMLFCELAVIAVVARKIIENPKFELDRRFMDDLHKSLEISLNSFTHRVRP